ncbi:hypothetical protein HK098_006135 [Nowakowskiella sp. JEL0407]|nr:hypothetical protein HK098_006135 [Nowakowskiella sp. JEL0407]
MISSSQQSELSGSEINLQNLSVGLDGAKSVNSTVSGNGANGGLKGEKVVSKVQVLKGDPVVFVPSVLPTLEVKHVLARGVELKWGYENEDGKGVVPNDGEIIYQLMKTEVSDPSFEIIYEGISREFRLDGLTPSTKYRFRLRLKPFFDPLLNQPQNQTHLQPSKKPAMDLPLVEYDWSRQYAQIEVCTTDETLINKALNQLVRYVQDPAVQPSLVAAILAQYGREINMETRDKYGKTLLMIACQSGNPDVISLLIEYGASMSATTQSGKTPLSLAVSFGNLKAVEILLKHGAPIDQPDQGGSTPLMWAVDNVSSKNGLAILCALLQSGASVQTEDTGGQSPLERLCVTSGNVAAFKLLVSHGAKIITVPDKKKHPKTTLMTAAIYGHKDLIKELLDVYDVDVSPRTEFGYNAEHFAAAGGFVSIVDMLQKKWKASDGEKVEAEKRREERKMEGRGSMKKASLKPEPLERTQSFS